jgi:diguanylate cyclase (GGDEF)-like protein
MDAPMSDSKLKGTLLIVDDEPDVQIMFDQRFRRKIRSGEFVIHYAENGVEALDKLKRMPEIDLVLSDIKMPEMDGLTLLDHIGNDYPNLAVIMITAFADMANIRAAMNAGAFDFINKPFSFADLQITIDKALTYVAKLRSLEKERTEKERVQRELLRHMQRMDKIKDEFLANTSHELYTPLNGIIGIAESLSDGAAGEIEDHVRDNLEVIVSCGKRMASLVGDILDFAKLKNKDLQLDLAPSNLQKITRDVMNLFHPLVENNPVQLELTIDPTPFPPVFCDENRLIQILHNLVGNALKFTKEGYVTIQANVQGDFAEISVIDTGIGIDPAHHSDIFNSFEQVDGSSTRSYGGTGLGLAITKRLVELQGGTIEVESALGKGATFRFTIPLARQDVLALEEETSSTTTQRDLFSLREAIMAASSPMASPIVEDKAAVRILVSDDDTVNLQVLLNQLTMRGYMVTTAATGEETLDILQRDPHFDLVLLDVMMPDISGFEVCRHIRKRRSLYDLPILMLTAKSRPEDCRMGLEQGANDYVTKPFDKEELIARVQNLLTLKQAVQNAIVQARRLEAEQKQREYLEQLRSMTEDLTSTLELSQVTRRFLTHVTDAIPCQSAWTVLVEDQRMEVMACRHVGDQAGASQSFAPIAIPWNDTLNQVRGPVIMSQSFVDEFIEAVQSATQPGPCLAMPLVTAEQVRGYVLMIHHPEEGFDTDTMELAYTLAKQGAVAIENARLFEKISKMAVIDSLTGLYNRRYFFIEGKKALRQSVRYKKPLSVMILDVDHFKLFNDTHGHATGDKALTQVAEAILHSCRETDVAARYGGEEFVVLLPETDIDEAFSAAERLRRSIQLHPIEVEGLGQLPLTVSVGVATYSVVTNEFKTLLKHADEALYDAKKSGRNAVRCYQSKEASDVS